MSAEQAQRRPARVALLIDCDNVSWQRAAAIIAEATTHGVLGVKRGYGDWGSSYLKGWRSVLPSLAIQPVQQIAYSYGKGATDIALVIDAMDLLYSGQVDTFCLVANDSDYTRLAMRLREAGTRVVGIGAKSASGAFSNACDRFTFLEVLAGADSVDEEQAMEEVAAAPPPGDAQPVLGLGAAEAGPSAGDVPELADMLESAVSARLEDDGWALLSNVGFQLVANHPAFDSRNYGYARLGLLMSAQPNIELREVQSAGGNKVVHVRLVGTG
ncbi:MULTISPECIES: NYN domain-containing protein [unclassified Modestobacter]|uniref:NYN domain-containing protein n=1 Tax=unclassified Modestobacter TaxID=2643866 RepID=UPI0022A9F80E|nr:MULTISPECIES: NYN domain-containing protein [unclassified Modestobacter]MCZ2825877.1 NYN domain-containing protein [Modestobacter sp. VKM Ac-2981]MCZ2853058.1 NYN domain-containing protein [Modestobacter sp. VKM Ac-2982]